MADPLRAMLRVARANLTDDGLRALAPALLDALDAAERERDGGAVVSTAQPTLFDGARLQMSGQHFWRVSADHRRASCERCGLILTATLVQLQEGYLPGVHLLVAGTSAAYGVKFKRCPWDGARDPP